MSGTLTEEQFQQIDTQISSISSSTNRYVVNSNDIGGIEDYEELKNKKPEQIKPYILSLLDYTQQLSLKADHSEQHSAHNRNSAKKINITYAVIGGLLRRNQQYSENEWMALFQKLNKIHQSLSEQQFYIRLTDFPFNYAIQQMERKVKKENPSKELIVFIKEMLAWKLFQKEHKSYWGSDMGKAVSKLNGILKKSGEIGDFKLKTNDIGPQVNEIVAKVTKNTTAFYQVLYLATGASGGKPNKKFIEEVERLIAKMGRDNYRKAAQHFLQIAIKQNIKEEEINYQENYSYTVRQFLCDPSKQFIKGIVWTMQSFSDKESIRLLGKLLEKSFEKIPGVGPAAVAVGNACAYTLGNIRGKDGLGELARLKVRLKQNNIKKTIDKYLLEGAKKYNVSVEELKEMAVPTFDLENGEKTIVFEDYQLKINIEGSKIVQQWIKPDGTDMKSVPNIIKKSTVLSKKLKNIRKEIKEIQKTHSAQKQRIDNQFVLNRTWDYQSFDKYYLEHGLVSIIAKKLIWIFIKGNRKASVVLIDDEWQTENGEKIDWIDSECSVQLWHPVFAKEKEIIAWREKMMTLEWKQPFKQAFRELYILTDAELNTRNYSNRMAAHIIKQHQFKTLAVMRDWKYALMGAYDDGIYDQVAEKQLPEYGITAEYWIDEVNDFDAFNDTGIWLYVATDQVKFKNDKGEVMDLINVPPIVFSEIMRDVDLFVGVCSVGNDPEWQNTDGVREHHRTYWSSYSFGNLTEIAKTRKSILERLLPRLSKIRNKAHVDGKFLIVKGDLRTYKIHIGSSNILMEPNDQYLCIVPARSPQKAVSKLFIPFEGDRGLSIVLSKAFLLAEDTKITDPTIVSQIKGR